MREMYRNEHLPYALFLGIKEADFWEMNPRLMKPYNEAHRLELKRQDEIAWEHGQYILQALLSTVGNMFKKKGAEPYEYPSKPHIQAYEDEKREAERIISEKEKKQKVDNLFMSLRIMQANFNNQHNREVNHNG